MTPKQLVHADRAFEKYNFGPDVEVEDFEGWESSNNNETVWRNVFIKAEVGPDTKLVIFSVCFDSVGGATGVDAYALMTETGEKIGSMPDGTAPDTSATP